jgi:hypothetical protein
MYQSKEAAAAKRESEGEKEREMIKREIGSRSKNVHLKNLKKI